VRVVAAPGLEDVFEIAVPGLGVRGMYFEVWWAKIVGLRVLCWAYQRKYNPQLTELPTMLGIRPR